MSEFTFQMLLQCQYTGDKNDVEQLHVEHLAGENWQDLDLNLYTPGFDVFMYAILACQHMYFRMNAAEYGLILESCEGLITVMADKHRSIETLNVDFKGKLKQGDVTDDKINSIAARMSLCPVSINLKDIPNNITTVNFEEA